MKRDVLFGDRLKLLVLSFVFLFTFGIFLPLVSSANALTVDIPAGASSISGTQIITANLDTNTLNLTFAWTHLMFSNGTNVTLDSYRLNVTNTQFNFSFVTTAYVDDDDVTFWVRVANETSLANRTAYTTADINIDNGNPTATLSSATANNEYRAKYSKDTVTYGVNADNTLGISSCRVIFTDRKNNTVTDTGTTMTGYACANTTITCQQVGMKGRSYNVVVQATDGNTDRTNSSTRVLSCLTDPANAPATGVGGAGGGGRSFGQMVSSFASDLGSFFRSLWANTLGRIF